jgi:hypothetical protein
MDANGSAAPAATIIEPPPRPIARIHDYKRHRNAGHKPRKNKTGKPFVQLFKCWLTSTVFRSLTMAERIGVITIMSLYNGSNNGKLPVSERWLAMELGCGRATAHRILDRLKAAGLIEIISRGKLQGRASRASRWRLTCYACDVTGRQAEDWTRLLPLTSAPPHGKCL